MSETIQVKVDVDFSDIEKKVSGIIDDTLMLQVHQLFAKMCEPYVPFDSGVLSQTTEITPEYVRYSVPYAHYMYKGNVYGLNIPIKKNGQIVGWFSKPGVTKTPTGQKIKYNTSGHPLATSEWDKAMITAQKDSFIEQVRQLIIRRAKQLYG